MQQLLNLISFEQLLVCWCIVMVATVLQISAGMGFGMLASPLIALVKPELVPGCVVIMGLFVAFAGAWKERKNIRYEEIGAGVSGRIIGSLMAFFILLLIPNIDVFMILFGFIMLTAIFFSVIGIEISFSIKNLFGLSIVSGVMGSLTAIGAPPMALIYHGRSPEIIRPTLNVFFFSGCVLALISLISSGWFRVSDLFTSLALVPALLVGFFIGNQMRNVSSKSLSRFLLALSATASVMLIVRGVGIFG